MAAALASAWGNHMPPPMTDGCATVHAGPLPRPAEPRHPCSDTEWHDRFVVDWARARRETIRQLTGLHRKLAAAQTALAGTQITLTQAEAAFDAAGERVAQAENTLDAARAEHAQARQQRYAARQAYARASTAVERLQRQVDQVSERLNRMPPLTARLHRMVHLGAAVSSSAQTHLPTVVERTPHLPARASMSTKPNPDSSKAPEVRGSGDRGSASCTSIRNQVP